MSWDATLTDDRGHIDGDWNYTHNTSAMIYAAYESRVGVDLPSPWWGHLDGFTGPDGAVYLSTIIGGLEADPDRYRAMNPPNGWGDYDGLLVVLREMRDRVPAWPTVWRASG